MTRITILFFRCIIFFLPVVMVRSQTLELQGQLLNWITLNADKVSESSAGIRYIPGLWFHQPVLDKYNLDAEISVNAYGSAQLHASRRPETGSKAKLYRGWCRLASSQFEVRLGLQKINFGSAMLLRPLMWFDRMDPRDPLQLTDGVYGLLFRYYFLTNTNIWLWGLTGNDETKGWEIIPSDGRKVEYGGRLQVPVSSGELAVSLHHRWADLSKGFMGPVPAAEKSIPENRFGLDGKFDIGIGLWFEGVVIHQNIEYSFRQYQRFINLGMDYTFDLGNGLRVMTEYLHLETVDKVFGAGDGLSFSAWSLTYPAGLLDNFVTMVYYDWDHHDWYRFINWQRLYDKWSIYLIGFWNPAQLQIYQNQQQNNLFAGTGIQLMVVLNH